MKVLSRIFLLLSVLLSTIAAIIVFFVVTFDANHYKTQISQLVKENTGRDLQLDGNITLSVYPNIALDLGVATFSNAAGFDDNPFATVQSAKIAVQLIPLLKQKLVINKIALDGLQLNLHKKVNGEANWDSFLETTADKEIKQGQFANKFFNNFSIAGVELNNSAIYWRDDTQNQEFIISPVSFTTAAFQANKPTLIQITGTVTQRHPTVSISGTLSTTLTLGEKNQSFSLKKTRLNISKSSLPVSKLELSGDIEGNLKQLHITGFKLHLVGANNLLPQGKFQLRLEGDTTINIEQQTLQIPAMQVQTTLTDLLDDSTIIKAIIHARVIANLKQSQVVLQNATIKTNLVTDAFKGGELQAELSSPKIITNLKTQQFQVKKIELRATLKGGIIPKNTLVYRSEGNINVNLSSNKGNAQFKNIVLEMAGAKLTGSAKLTQLSPQPTIVGNFKTNQFNLKPLLTAFGITLPATSKANLFANSTASFKVNATPENVKLHHLTLRIDQSKITGNMTLSHFKQPIIKTKLIMDQLILDDYFTVVPDKRARRHHSNDKLLPIELLKSLHLDSSMEIKKLRFNQINFTKVHATIKAKNGKIDANPLRFHAFKGKYQGKLSIDVTSNVPMISMRHQLQQLPAENVLLQFYQDRYISGDIDITANFTTRGNTIATIKQNLTGNANIEFRKGTIRDSKLAKEIALSINAFERKKMNPEGQQQMVFTKLGGDWNANNGVFHTENMQLISPYFAITGKGRVDIVKHQLDLKLRLRSKNSNSKLFAPLHIYGPIDSLNYQLELDELVKTLLQEDLYNKKEQLKQNLLDERSKALQALETRKKTELEKLQAKKEAAQQRLKNEQKIFRQRLENQYQLQDKLKQEQEKLQDQLKDRLKGLL